MNDVPLPTLNFDRQTERGFWLPRRSNRQLFAFVIIIVTNRFGMPDNLSFALSPSYQRRHTTTYIVNLLFFFFCLLIYNMVINKWVSDGTVYILKKKKTLKKRIGHFFFFLVLRSKCASSLNHVTWDW